MKLMNLIALVLGAIVSIQARIFNNPIFSEQNHYESNAIKVNGIYYMVSYSNNFADGLFTIQTSTDLVNWKFEGYVFDNSNKPLWANEKIASPKMHQIGNNFLVYFGTSNITGFSEVIGVASAAHPLGPYSAIDRPLLSETSIHARHPSIINDGVSLYLLWSNDCVISARPLNGNGFSFSFNEDTTLIKPTLSWEEGALFFPWYIKRGRYHYVIYNGPCNAGIGVARSTHVTGPYEKLATPIFVPRSNYGCPKDVSVVKDVDNVNDVILFNVQETNDSSVVVAASLNWNAYDWPYIGTL